MRTITFTVSKGGVGKSLITANVGASLAQRGKRVALLEGDPNHPLRLITGIRAASDEILFEGVVRKDLPAGKATYPTRLANLSLIPSGVSLEAYFELDPIRFANKISELDFDFLFIDTPFPLGKAAFLSLGVCEYFVPVLTEDEFTLCVESAIDTIRLGRYFFKCTPLGFILNRIRNADRFNEKFVKDLEDLLEIECIAKINEDPMVSKSYGATTGKAFLAYEKLPASEFAARINQITDFILKELPRSSKGNVQEFLKSLKNQ